MADVSHNVVLDGYVIVSTKLNVLRENLVNFLGPHDFNPVVRYVTQNDYKGIARLYKMPKNAKGIELCISNTNHRRFSIFVTPEDGAEGVNPMEFKDQVKAAYIAAFKKGMKRIENEPSRAGVLAQNEEKYLAIYNDNFESFGTGFMTKMNADLTRLMLRACFVWWDLGPIGYLRRNGRDVNDVSRMLMNFELQHAEEIIFHVARDYFQDQKCILWKKMTNQDLGLEGSYTHYHNLMTGPNYASTEFSTYKKPDYGRKLNNAGVQYASLKFYISPLKEVHLLNTCGAPWKEPIVERAFTLLTSKEMKDRNYTNKYDLKNPKDVLNWIRVTEGTVNMLRRQKYSTARFEAILRMNGNFRRGTENECIIEHFMAYFDGKFPNHQMQKKLAVRPYKEMLQQLQDTLGVALNTLKPIAEKVVELRNQENANTLASIPIHEDVQRAMVCEAIICYVVYGKINHKATLRGLNYFNHKFISYLGFNRLRNRPDESTKDVLWGKLNHLHMVRTGGFSASNPPSFAGPQTAPVLHYAGQYFLDKIIWQNIEHETNIEYLKELHMAFLCICSNGSEESDEARNERRAAAHKTVAKVVWKAVTKYAGWAWGRNGNDVTLRTPDAVRKAIEIHNDVIIRYETSMEFVENFFRRPEEYSQIGLSHLFRDIKEYYQRQSNTNGQQCLQNLQKEIICYFDQQLYCSLSLAVFYPVNKTKAIWTVILPCFGHAKDSFRWTSADSAYHGRADEKRRHIVNYYYDCYKRAGPKPTNILASRSLHSVLLTNSMLGFEKRECESVCDVCSEALKLHLEHLMSLA